MSPSCLDALRSVFIVQEFHHVWKTKSQTNLFSFLKFQFD
jgi:hypothetical protein